MAFIPGRDSLFDRLSILCTLIFLLSLLYIVGVANCSTLMSASSARDTSVPSPTKESHDEEEEVEIEVSMSWSRRLRYRKCITLIHASSSKECLARYSLKGRSREKVWERTLLLSRVLSRDLLFLLNLVLSYSPVNTLDYLPTTTLLNRGSLAMPFPRKPTTLKSCMKHGLKG